MGYFNSLRLNHKGFSLIEILAAIVILGVGLVSIMSLFPLGFKLQKDSEDNSKVSLFAETLLNEIILKSTDIYTGVNNSLTGATEYPTAAPDPEPFTNDPRYLWHYSVTVNPLTTIDRLYRVDLAIYTLEGASNNTPYKMFTTYINKED